MNRFRNPINHFAALLLTAALVTTSCLAGVTATATPSAHPDTTQTTPLFRPGESLPQGAAPGQPLLTPFDLSQAPDPVRAETVQSVVRDETGNVLREEPIQKGEGKTDDQGVIMLFDPTRDVQIPIAVLDEGGQPIPELDIQFVIKSDAVLIAVSDPDQRFAPQLVTLSMEELLSAASQSQPSHSPLSDFLSVKTAHAAPQAALITIGIIIVIIKIISVVLVTTGVYKVAVNPKQLFSVAGDDAKYACKNPERMGAEAGLMTHALGMFVGPVSGKVGELLVEVTKTSASFLVEQGVAESTESPILYKEYYYSPEETEVIFSGNGITSAIPANGMRIVEEVGECSYVPDVVGQPIEEVRDLLSGSDITWAEVPETAGASTTSGIVVAQNPPAWEELVIGIPVRNMLPIGLDYLNEKLELVVGSPEPTATFTPAPPPTETPTPVPKNPTIYLPGPTFCRAGNSKDFAPVWTFGAGTTLNVIGTDGNGWYKVEFSDPRTRDTTCWIGAGNPQNVSQVPVVETPPPPIYALQDVAVSQREITISVRDYGAIDGDRIRLTVNGVILLSDYTLTGSFYTVSVTLNSGPNQIIITALNVGSEPPNTVEILISNVVSGVESQVASALNAGNSYMVITAP